MKRSKRLTAFLLVVVIILSVTPMALAASPSLSNFKAIRTYTTNQFPDITGRWFQNYVIQAYEVGMIDGFDDGTFKPDDNLSIAGAIKLAACLNSIYSTGSQSFTNGSPWYQPYVNYCISKGILTQTYSDYNAMVTRAQFAEIFANCLPSSALPAINTVNDNCIPDVKITDSFGPAVYKLYRAGIISGDAGTYMYRPYDNIKRSEVSTLLTHMMDTSTRVTLTLTTPVGGMNAEQIYDKCASSVFYIITYDKNGDGIAQGSGVMLTASGQAVTNYHVIEGAYSAKIWTTDGKSYNVAGIYDWNENTDLARLQIQGSGFTPMAIGDSRSVKTGAEIYTIGNPEGLESTLSTGVISSANRTINGMTYIQVTAPISHGSSGGALINNQGQLIGITSATVSSGQNLNLCVPIHRLEELGYTSYKSLPEAFGSTGTTVTGYTEFPSVPDFGSFSGAPLYTSVPVTNGVGYLYLPSQIPGGMAATDYAYYEYLTDNGFYYLGDEELTDSNILCDIYTNSSQTILLATSMEFTSGGVTFYMVMVLNA